MHDEGIVIPGADPFVIHEYRNMAFTRTRVEDPETGLCGVATHRSALRARENALIDLRTKLAVRMEETSNPRDARTASRHYFTESTASPGTMSCIFCTEPFPAEGVVMTPCRGGPTPVDPM